MWAEQIKSYNGNTIVDHTKRLVWLKFGGKKSWKIENLDNFAKC
jgi:hypothetical protein